MLLWNYLKLQNPSETSAYDAAIKEKEHLKAGVCEIETVQDFLIKLDIKPLMHLHI